MLNGGEEARDAAAGEGEGLYHARRVFHALPGATRDEVLQALAFRLAQEGAVREPGELVTRLVERERLGCTGLGGGVAIPHCKLRDLDEVVVAVASTERPIDFGAADGLPVSLIFLVASPAGAAAPHLQALARISRLLRTPGVADALRAARSSVEMLGVLRGAEASRAVPS
jgi:PTS system nitrogen regulatory IIA component